MKSNSPDIVIIGHLAKDIIEIDGISYNSLGGAVYYGGIAGRYMGIKISIITRLKKSDYNLLEIFNKNQIQYYVYPSEETTGLRNIYSSKNMEFREYKPLGFAGSFKKEELPKFKKPPKYFLVGPIVAHEVDIDLLKHIKKKYRNVCLDIQGFIRYVDHVKVFYKPLTLEEKKEIISNINVLKLDQTEAKILTGYKDFRKAAKDIAGFGPKEILITHEKGVSLYKSNEIYSFQWKSKNFFGRTGRGDTAFVSYLGSRINKDPEESLKFAAALTSLKLEKPGPFNLPIYRVEELIKNKY
ncbi:MAG: PfkB family carbohydrate kinase [Candidatus Thorarchaeota archaeon]